MLAFGLLIHWVWLSLSCVSWFPGYTLTKWYTRVHMRNLTRSDSFTGFLSLLNIKMHKFFNINVYFVTFPYVLLFIKGHCIYKQSFWDTLRLCVCLQIYLSKEYRKVTSLGEYATQIGTPKNYIRLAYMRIATVNNCYKLSCF